MLLFMFSDIEMANVFQKNKAAFFRQVFIFIRGSPRLITTNINAYFVHQLAKTTRPLASYGLPPTPSPQPHPPPHAGGGGGVVDHLLFILYYLVSIFQHVSHLVMGALPSNSLLHSLPLQKL